MPLQQNNLDSNSTAPSHIPTFRSGPSAGAELIGGLSLWLGTAMFLRCWVVLFRYTNHAPKGVSSWKYMWHDTLQYDWGWLAAMFFTIPILAFFGGATQVVGISRSNVGVVQGVNLIDGAFGALWGLWNGPCRRYGFSTRVFLLFLFAVFPIAFFFLSCTVLYFWWFQISPWFASIAPGGSSPRTVLIFVNFVKMAGIVIPPVLYFLMLATAKALTSQRRQ